MSTTKLTTCEELAKSVREAQSFDVIDTLFTDNPQLTHQVISARHELTWWASRGWVAFGEGRPIGGSVKPENFAHLSEVGRLLIGCWRWGWRRASVGAQLVWPSRSTPRTEKLTQ